MGVDQLPRRGTVKEEELDDDALERHLATIRESTRFDANGDVGDLVGGYTTVDGWRDLEADEADKDDGAVEADAATEADNVVFHPAMTNPATARATKTIVEALQEIIREERRRAKGEIPASIGMGVIARALGAGLALTTRLNASSPRMPVKMCLARYCRWRAPRANSASIWRRREAYDREEGCLFDARHRCRAG